MTAGATAAPVDAEPGPDRRPARIPVAGRQGLKGARRSRSTPGDGQGPFAAGSDNGLASVVQWLRANPACPAATSHVSFSWSLKQDTFVCRLHEYVLSARSTSAGRRASTIAVGDACGLCGFL